MRARLWPAMAMGMGALVAAALQPQPLGAQEADREPAAPTVPGPTFEDVLSLRDIGGATISPDGNAIAYTVRTTDWDENRYDTEIWLVRVGEEPFQLTRTADGSSFNVEFSPDGKWLSFVANRGDKNQIHLIGLNGGEAWALTEAKQGVGGYEWSPDGTRIAFMMTEPEADADEEREEEYGAWEVEDAEYRMTHLWVVEIPDEPGTVEAERITEGDEFTVSSFDWSPDGTRIAFEHRTDPLINSWMRADISIVDVATREITPLVSRAGYDGGPTWSPDGEWIAYSAGGPDTTSVYYTNSRFYKIPSGGGEIVQLAADLDEDPFITAWTPRGIYLVGWERTKRRVYRVDPNTGRTETFANIPDRIWSVSFTPDGRTMSLVGRTDGSLDEVYRSSVSRFRPEQLTNMTQQIEGWSVGASEVISWQSTDGTTIEGVLHKPDDFDPSRTYPLLVVIHGGPTGIDYPTPVLSYVYPVNQWLAKGALVLRPNYRGSAGYGEGFRSLNVRNLGLGDYEDVISGVDALIETGWVDPERVGAMGWSQGGYISAFITTYSDRFKAVSVGAGISNWVTYYVNTDIHPFTRQYLKSVPWLDTEIYERTSPMTFITQAATPTLIQHGEFDRRVPIPNAYELYQGLQDMGVDTKLIVYKGFGHGISKPKERLAAVWHNWQWFGKYLWDEEIELPLGDEDEEEAEEVADEG